MKKRERKIILTAAVMAVMFGISPRVNAMHIMEGYLPATHCIAWGILSVPFLLAGFFSIKRRLQTERRSITLLAMAGAYIFVISSLKIPSVTGSCSHRRGLIVFSCSDGHSKLYWISSKPVVKLSGS